MSSFHEVGIGTVPGVVESIQIGRIGMFEAEGIPGVASRPWPSAIIKTRVEGAVFVDRTNVQGDQQADLQHHGGPDKAVLAYAAAHYPKWNAEYPEAGFLPGAFGENLTVRGMDESTCCIGDTLSIGQCVFQVSQPRQPCWKLSRRWNLPRFAITVQNSGRTGWYLRVLIEGYIQSGQTIRLVERPFPEFTVAWANRVMHGKDRQKSDDLLLASCSALSESWKTTLRSRGSHGELPNVQLRLDGESAGKP